MEYDFAKEYRDLWDRLALERHIVLSLKKKGNAKQNADLARKIFQELKPEIIEDMETWYRKKEFLGDQIDAMSVRDDILHRINAELAKYGVPLISFELLR